MFVSLNPITRFNKCCVLSGVVKPLVTQDVKEEVDGIVQLLAIYGDLPKRNDRWIVRVEQILLPEKTIRDARWRWP